MGSPHYTGSLRDTVSRIGLSWRTTNGNSFCFQLLLPWLSPTHESYDGTCLKWIDQASLKSRMVRLNTPIPLPDPLYPLCPPWASSPFANIRQGGVSTIFCCAALGIPEILRVPFEAEPQPYAAVQHGGFPGEGGSRLPSVYRHVVPDSGRGWGKKHGCNCRARVMEGIDDSHFGWTARTRPGGSEHPGRDQSQGRLSPSKRFWCCDASPFRVWFWRCMTGVALLSGIGSW